MTSTSDRRRQDAETAVIDHAIDLKCSHGTLHAISYLRAHHIQEGTIRRVMFGHWCDHRVQDCLAHHH